MTNCPKHWQPDPELAHEDLERTDPVTASIEPDDVSIWRRFGDKEREDKVGN
jgi:hypothetical protein